MGLSCDLYGRGRIRTYEGRATRFTVWPVWPLRNTPVFVTRAINSRGGRENHGIVCTFNWPGTGTGWKPCRSRQSKRKWPRRREDVAGADSYFETLLSDSAPRPVLAC